MRRLVRTLVAACLALAAPCAPAQEPLALITEALQLAAQGEREAALERLARLDPAVVQAPIVQYGVGKAYETLELPAQAAAWYFRSAKATQAGGGLVLGKRELQALVPELAPPADYWTALRAGREREAINAAPWWPAAYWVLGMRSRVAGRQSDATIAMRDFAQVMDLTGLKGPFREWLLHAEQVRDQVSKLETDFLVEAGLLAPDWNRAGQGTSADITRVFGALEPEMWGLARSAMQYAYRFRSISVSAAGGADFRTIQAAIDDLGRSGGAGVIRIAPGVYPESLTFSNRARMHLRADRPRSVTVRLGSTRVLQILGGSRVVIDGLAFESTDGSAVMIEGTSRITLKNGSITASGGRALHIRDAEDVSLWRMDLRASGPAVVIERARDVSMIGGSAVGGPGDWAIDASSSQLALARVRVRGGKGGVLLSKRAAEPCAQRCSTLAMRASSVSGARGYGVAVLGGSEAWMVKNVFRQLTEGAVYSEAGELEATRNVVEDSGNGFIARGGNARLRENIISASGVGISALVTTVLEVQGNEIEGGETGIEASDTPAVLRLNRVTRQSKAGIFVERPLPGWVIEGNELGFAGTGLVLDAALTASGSCFDGRTPRIAQNVFYRNTNGMAAGVEATSPGAGLCVEKNTFVSNAKAGAWLVHKGGRPAVQFSRNILALNGGGLLDDAGLVRVTDSVAFRNREWEAYPRLAAGRFEAADPQFVDADADDYRLSSYSPYSGRQIGADLKPKEASQ